MKLSNGNINLALLSIIILFANINCKMRFISINLAKQEIQGAIKKFSR